jgi:ribosome-interacting GTPase 1
VPALTRIEGVLVQFVEIPGLIEGANDDRGGGRALLGVLRGADAIVYCHACGSPIEALETVRAEVAAAGIEKPSILAATKADEGDPPSPTGLDVVLVSVLDDESLDRFRAAVWQLTGLVRVYLRDGGDPIALHPPVTVEDVAHSIHQELGERATGARVWGPSARFPGQRVGRTHELADGDSVEVVA